MSQSHPNQGAINEGPDPVDGAWVEQLSRYPTTQLVDSGAPIGVMAPELRPMTAETDFCGSAVTLWVKPGDILYVLKVPESIREGDVLVIDAGGRVDAAVIGDIFGRLVRDRGAVGLVVDGAVRDADGLRALGMPTYARALYPAIASKAGPGAINVPVQCGGVVVNPGDLVRADSSGIVVIPRDGAEETVDKVKVVAAREAEWRREFAMGKSPTEVLGLDELIAGTARSDDTPLP